MLRRLLPVALVTLVVAGCGSVGAATPSTPSPVGTGRVLASAPAQGLVATTLPVTTATLAGETTSDISAALADAGFLGGRERSFQGQSRDLSLVVSRELVFSDAAGAQRFLGYLHDHAEALFGLTTESVAVDVGGRKGWLFQAPECACPGAQPKIVGVLDDGSGLQWLSINGPRADRARMRALLAAPRTTS